MSLRCGTRENLIDFITGQSVPDTDDEPIRQFIERLLVEKKGFARTDIEVDRIFDLVCDGKIEQGRAELVVHVDGRPFMTIKSARGSLVTRERESLAASRLACVPPVPVTVVTNGQDAEIMDTGTGRVVATGLEAIPDKDRAKAMIREHCCPALADGRREKEARIYLAFADFQCPTDCE